MPPRRRPLLPPQTRWSTTGAICAALLVAGGPAAASSRKTSLAGAKELAAIAKGEARLHLAIHRSPQVLSHPGVRTLLRAIIADRVPSRALAVLKEVPALRPLIPYPRGPKLFTVERRVDRSDRFRGQLACLAESLLAAGLDVPDGSPNPFATYFADKWHERFPDKPLWPAPLYRRRTMGDHSRVGAHERIVATMAGAPVWALDDHPRRDGGFSELHLIRGMKYLGYAEYRIKPGGIMEHHHHVHRDFRELGIPSLLMATLLERNPGVKRIPSQIAKAHWRAFVAALGTDRFDQTRSDKRLFQLSAGERQALVGAIIAAVKATPVAKMRARHGFEHIARIVVQPHADQWNRLLVDFHRGPPATEAAIEVLFVTKTSQWKHEPAGLVPTTERGISGFSPRRWSPVPR